MDVGASIDLSGDDVFLSLFSESSARALVTVTNENQDAFVALAEAAGVPLASIGLTGGDSLDVAGDTGFSVSVSDLRADWSATLPSVLGPTFAPSARR